MACRSREIGRKIEGGEVVDGFMCGEGEVVDGLSGFVAAEEKVLRGSRGGKDRRGAHCFCHRFYGGKRAEGKGIKSRKRVDEPLGSRGEIPKRREQNGGDMRCWAHRVVIFRAWKSRRYQGKHWGRGGGGGTQKKG